MLDMPVVVVIAVASVLLLPAVVYALLRPPWWLGLGAGVLGFIIGVVTLSEVFWRWTAYLLGSAAGGLMGEGAALICVALWRTRRKG